jgi:hypothetical protein
MDKCFGIRRVVAAAISAVSCVTSICLFINAEEELALPGDATPPMQRAANVHGLFSPFVNAVSLSQ